MNVATSASLAELWQGLQYESAPVLWPVILRAWEALGLGGTDLGLRVLGPVSVFESAWLQIAYGRLY